MFELTTRFRASDFDRRRARRGVPRRRRLGLGAALLLSGITLGAPAAAQQLSSPIAEQYSMLARIMTYDRNLKVRAGDTLVVGILYQGWYAPSLDARNQLGRAIDQSPFKRIRGLPVRYVSIDIGNALPSSNELTSHDIDVLYITPVSGTDIRAIATLCREAGMTSVTGVSEYVEQGVAIGITAGALQPTITVHLPAAKAEGADFSSQLLKLAQVIR